MTMHEEEEEEEEENDDFNNTNSNNEKAFLRAIPEHIKTLALNQKENLARFASSFSGNRKDLFVKKMETASHHQLRGGRGLSATPKRSRVIFEREQHRE